jgi:oligopeptide transport system substrate-binding protein
MQNLRFGGDDVKAWRFFLVVLMLPGWWLSVGCGREGPAPGMEVRSRWNLPEVIYTAEGRPDPSILAPIQILHRGNGAQPQGLDPHLTEGVPSANIQRDLFESLVVEAADGSLVPGNAERWDVSEDGLVYIFHLRRNARWSNGDPVTAGDWVFSLRRAVTPATGSKYSMILSPILNAEEVIAGRLDPTELGVEEVDRHTLRIELKAPTPYFLGLLTHNASYPVHEPSIRRHGDAYGRVGNLVSNGPYQLRELVMQSHIRLVRNPYFWDDANTIIDEVFHYPIEDQSAELMRYRAGELDWTYEVPNAQFNWIARNLPDELVVSDYFGIYYFGFNTTRPPFDDPRVRTALSMAVDRDIITGKLTRFGEVPSYAFVPPGIEGYTPQEPEWAHWTQEQRVARARELMAEAGYTGENPLRLEIRYNTHQNHKKISLGIAAMWQNALGVHSSLINEEFRVFLATRRNRVVTEVFRAGWIGDYLDPYTFLDLMHSENPQNDVGFFHLEFDALLAKAAMTADAENRFRLLEQAESLMLSEQPVIPIYTYVSKRLVKPYVRGWKSNPLDHHPTRYMYLLRREPTSGGRP